VAEVLSLGMLTGSLSVRAVVLPEILKKINSNRSFHYKIYVHSFKNTNERILNSNTCDELKNCRDDSYTIPWPCALALAQLD
jgi:hypothetical protein